MLIVKYLIVTPVFSRYNAEKVSKADVKIVASLKESKMASNAVALRLNLELPDEIFKKPTFEATIKVDSDKVSQPVIEADVLDNIQEAISKQLGIDLKINVVEATKPSA